MMNDLQLPPVDAVRSFLAFVEFMKSPKDVEALSRQLLKNMESHAKSQQELKTATLALNQLKRETETAVAVAQQKSDERIAAASADYDRRVAERENGLAAREKRAQLDREQLDRDRAAVAKQKEWFEEKRKLLSA